jgi:hypothetical protein
MSEDYETDPVWEKEERPKKINSGGKGKRGERGLCQLLSESLKGEFSRIPQSGSRTSQVRLPEHLKLAYTGDIITPSDFRFCVEVKHGYPDIDFIHVVSKNMKSSTIDQFLEQAKRDAKKVKKIPMVCWKPNRMPWMCFLQESPPNLPDYFMKYRDWFVFNLEYLLQSDQSYFFK